MLPSQTEFLQMSAHEIQEWTHNKTVVFSPGGSSRWFFLEHGDIRQGYTQAEQFERYVQASIQRTFEITEMMMNDGIQTLFVMGIMPGQLQRDATYRENLARSLEYMANQAAQTFYDEKDIGVMFRGQWQQLFDHLNISDLLARCKAVEADTLPNRAKWLIWLTNEDPLPQDLAPFLQTILQKDGTLPTAQALAEAYYAGRAIQHVDIYISHNKPSVKNQIPPLTTMGDLYFTLAPTYYLDQTLWRKVLYDHLFARQGNKRDYAVYKPETIDDLREFVSIHQHSALGLGARHEPTQTWRPISFTPSS